MTNMPTLCGSAGTLPESYRQFINSEGELQIGDAFGLEAQWVIGLLQEEQEWDEPTEYIRKESVGVGCTLCGDESADTEYGLCNECADTREYITELIPLRWYL